MVGVKTWDELPKGAGHLPLLYVKNGQPWLPEPNTSNSPIGFYQSDFFADNLIESLKSRPDKPFFAYLPFCAPHLPIQCMEADRMRYRGQYDYGPDALRQKRLAALIEEGLIKPSVTPHEVFAKAPEWIDLNDREKKLSARAMETYAGMISAMDRAIGRVLNYLDEQNLTDSTLIMFMSDNGAEGNSLGAHPVNGPNLLSTIDKYYANSLDNLGNHNSFCWIGPLWAQASTAPNRLMKTSITEGGIRVPFIARFPGITAYKPGSICHSSATCMDLLPTFFDLAGGCHPNPGPNAGQTKALYRDRQVFGLRGKSWLSHLTNGNGGDNDKQATHSIEDAPVGWEAHNQAGCRHGKWKLIYIPLGHPTGTGRWQLYDLEADQGETDDLADAEPEVLAEMRSRWDQYVIETGTVFRPPISTSTSILWLPDQVGGDPIDAQRIWMTLGIGKRFTDSMDGAEKT